MKTLTVLITNLILDQRSGTEIVVRDLALGLKRRGHTAVVYTPQPGQLADELLRHTVPVVDDLARLAVRPDVIHGHHTVETVEAMLHFAGTPAVFTCHDWGSWYDEAPLSPLVRCYIAVDEACRDRMVCRDGVPLERVRILHNAVDLNRFRRRGPLPIKPSRAVVFSNTAHVDKTLEHIITACSLCGIAVEQVGGPNRIAYPEYKLPEFDLAFARGRSVLESLASGLAVIIADYTGFGGIVKRDTVEMMRRNNFGRRLMTETEVTVERIVDAIQQYNPEDAASVTDWVRANASLDDWLDQIIDIYREVLTQTPNDEDKDSLFGLAKWLVERSFPHIRHARERWHEREREGPDSTHHRSELQLLQAELQQLRKERDWLNQQLQLVQASKSWRLAHLCKRWLRAA